MAKKKARKQKTAIAQNSIGHSAALGVPRADAEAFMALYNAKKLSQAQQAAQLMIGSYPESAFAWKALGTTLMETDDASSALEPLAKSYELNPNDALTLTSLGAAYYRQGNEQQAIKCQEQAVNLQPEYGPAHYRLAEMLQSAGQHFRALEHAEKALVLGYNELSSRALLGALQYQTKYFSEALKNYHLLENKFPDNPTIFNNLGNLYKDIGRYEKAEQYYEKALEINPSLAMAYSNIFFAKHYNPIITQSEIFDFAKNWEKRFSLPLLPTVSVNKIKEKALRVGLISSGFRIHPVGQMIATALEKSRSDIHFYAYSTNDVNDHITQKIRSACKCWNRINHLSQEEIAELIQKDQIDILIDLSGHGDGSCLQAISMRPAPLCIKWVGGLVNTMGLKSIDYLLSDSIETPEGVDNQYTEKLIRLPDDYICYVPCSYAPGATSLPALKNRYITLGCLNNAAKISTQLLSEWSILMHQLPQSRLLLRGAQYESQDFCRRILDEMKEHGIEQERIVLEGPAKHQEFLETYQRIDIALDTWPYSGGLTTCEAMLMGVPVVTLPGPTFAGRHSATHLINAGLPELVTTSWDEYRQRVLELANDLPNLAVIRAGLRTILHYSPVCDAPRFANHFNNALRAIWMRYCEDKEPEALTFNKEGEMWFSDGEKLVEMPEGTFLENDGDTAFNWEFDGPIVIVDNAAILSRNPDYPKWMVSGHLAVISFDPASLLSKKVEELKVYGELHHYPHALLGDGQPAILYATLDAEKSSTLKPLPQVQLQEYQREKLKILAELPINTVALDNIDGLSSLDMLLLDDLHDALKVLEHGGKYLKNTLLIQVKIAFQPTHENQTNLAELQSWANRNGFRVYTIQNQYFRSHFPSAIGGGGNQGSELESAEVLLFPNKERMEALSIVSLEKAAFILDRVLSNPDAAAYFMSYNVSDRKLSYFDKREEINEKEVNGVQFIDVSDLVGFEYSDPEGVAVIMPCVDKELGYKTASALISRASISFKLIIAYDSKGQGFVKTLNDVALRCEVRYVVYLAQDAFPGRGWLSLAYRKLEETGKGLLAFNDGKWHGKIASFGMVRKAWVYSIYKNEILFSGYKSHCADDELTYIANLSDNLVYDPNIVLFEIDYNKGMFGGGNKEDRALLNLRVSSNSFYNYAENDFLTGWQGGLEKGFESEVVIEKNQVFKKYNDRYYDFNEKYSRKGERYFLEKYTSPYFVDLLSASDGGITLENAGTAIGCRNINIPEGRSLKKDVNFKMEDFVNWLVGLKEELRKLGIQHRDINPLNIVYSEVTNNFKLIDFTWAVESRSQDFAYAKKAPGLNPYARYDNEAIHKMIDEAKGVDHLKRELHIIIVWSSGEAFRKQIEEKMEKSFKILDAFQINWGDSLQFNENMRQFYGQNLPPGCKKEIDIGVKPFTCYVVEDGSPNYDYVNHWGEKIYVNNNVYNFKMENRNNNGNYHNFIHATNDAEEFYRDSSLLLGKNYIKSIFKKREWDGGYINLSANVKLPSYGWSSIEEFFSVLDKNVRYVVLRNFENLPQEYTYGEHGDIDILVDDLDLALKIADAVYVKNEVHYKVLIKGEFVHFDFRFVGDQYYHKKWQYKILSQSLNKNGFRSPNLEEYFYSLIYHCLIHKVSVKDDYLNRLNDYSKMLGIKGFGENKMIHLLGRYMKKHGYAITVPTDKSVVFNLPVARELGFNDEDGACLR